MAHSDLCSNMRWKEKRMSKGTIPSLLESVLVLTAVKGQAASVEEVGIRKNARIPLSLSGKSGRVASTSVPVP